MIGTILTHCYRRKRWHISMGFPTRSEDLSLHLVDLMWRGIPFNWVQKAWIYEDRSQLPASYSFHDWWAEDALVEEARLARVHMIPWSLRGPPDGPGPGKRKLWRGLKWKPHKMQWMNRGGECLKDRNRNHFRKRKPIFFVPRRW